MNGSVPQRFDVRGSLKTPGRDLRRHRRHLPRAARRADRRTGARRATPARRLRDALEPIATQGWWSRPAGEGLTALGVDFFPGYVWGRAAALGTPTASVVAATFGVFEPGMIAAAYEAGVASATATTSWRREQPVAPRVSTRSQVLTSAPRSPIRCSERLTGSTASADRCSARSVPCPCRHRRAVGCGGQPNSSVSIAVTVTSLRSWRQDSMRWRPTCSPSGGSASRWRVQRDAWVRDDALADGVSRLQARGWMQGDELTDSGRAARAAIEAATDAGQQALVEACGDGLDQIIRLAADISTRLVDVRSFPADPRKRAGG